jgi:succinoglycan biosynthesis protein ExoA
MGLWMLEAGRPQSETDRGGLAADDLVTVVIPAYNEEETISQCLKSVLSQQHQTLEVLVVDGGSRDGTRSLVSAVKRSDRRVELLENRGHTIPRALNIALAAAHGRWFVRVDAHSTVPPDYVEKAVRHLTTGRWGGVGGRKEGVAATVPGRAVVVALGSPFGVGNSLYHYGRSLQTVDHVPFGAYPTELARHLGGWDERLVANEDFEFDHRLLAMGYELLFDPELRISWRCRESIRELFQQYRRYGRGKAVVARLHPKSLRARHAAPPALVAVLTGAGLLARRRPRQALAVAAPYLAAVAVATVKSLGQVEDARSAPFLPASFVAMHIGWGLGFWEGCLDAFQPRTKRRVAAHLGCPAQSGSVTS